MHSKGKKEPKIQGPAQPSLPSDCSDTCVGGTADARSEGGVVGSEDHSSPSEARQVGSARQPAPRPEAIVPVGEAAEQGFGEMAAPRGRNLYRGTSEYCGFHSRHHSKASFTIKREVPFLLGEALVFR